MGEVLGGIDALFAEADMAAVEAMELFLEFKPSLRAAYDARSMRLAREDMGHHIRNFAAIAFSPDDKSLLDYLSWLKVLFDGFGFTDEDIKLSFRCAGRAAGKRLSGNEAAAFENLVERAVFEYGRSEPVANRYLKEGLPDNGIARSYVQAVIEGRRDFAQALVDSELRAGKPARSLYLELFQPAQRELGRLWHTRKISVAQEHFATAATQYIMSTLYPRLMAESRPNGRLVLAACAQGELHELGLRMVADFFQADGWDTRFLGANLPLGALAAEVTRIEPDLVALSASIPTNVRWVDAAVKTLRAKTGKKPAILVGGIPFVVSPGLWRELGADGTGIDCQEAVAVGDRLVGKETRLDR
ncbi:MAG: hypothetical protein CVV51_07660 [Spirochaetae bacterium HGW-Spirochaetae-7]|nr:MAG: hypothetical protein CVV51_07660 [Spirochaetae bacterium HGW-Spirochaetae-7]